MIFNSKNVVKKMGRFVLPKNAIAKVGDSLSDSIFADFWNGFSFGFSKIVFEKAEDFVFLLGEADILNANGNAYAINVTEKGISISANDHRGLVMGFMTLMDKVQIDDFDDDIQVFVDCFELVESPLIENRMVHLCVLPETELWELQKFVRLVGALKFSHIILEFWGNPFMCIPSKILGHYCNLDAFYTLMIYEAKKNEYSQIAIDTFCDNIRLAARLHSCGIPKWEEYRADYGKYCREQMAWGITYSAEARCQIKMRKHAKMMANIKTQKGE